MTAAEYAEVERDKIRHDLPDANPVHALNSIRHTIGGRYNVIPQAAARLRSMEEALKPFAISPERDNASLHDDWQVARNPEITMGDLRRACAALQGDGQ